MLLTGQLGDDTGQADLALVGQFQLVEGCLDLGSGLIFLIAQFGFFEDAFAQGDDLFTVFVDGLADQVFHSLNVHKISSFR